MNAARKLITDKYIKQIPMQNLTPLDRVVAKSMYSATLSIAFGDDGALLGACPPVWVVGAYHTYNEWENLFPE